MKKTVLFLLVVVGLLVAEELRPFKNNEIVIKNTVFYFQDFLISKTDDSVVSFKKRVFSLVKYYSYFLKNKENKISISLYDSYKRKILIGNIEPIKNGISLSIKLYMGIYKKFYIDKEDCLLLIDNNDETIVKYPDENGLIALQKSLLRYKMAILMKDGLVSKNIGVEDLYNGMKDKRLFLK